MKNEMMPKMNPQFSVILSTKKFIRSNSQPQTGFNNSRAAFGITPVMSATINAVRACPFTCTPYLGFARYSTRSGDIIRVAKPRNIQEMIVNRNILSWRRNRKAWNGCVPPDAVRHREGHCNRQEPAKPDAAAKTNG